MSQPSPQRIPVVSVIMPSYNTAPLIGACLDSVFQQTFHDFEIVLVNDGSPDTPQLEQVLAPYLEKHADKIVYIKQPNKRCAGARNTAIRNSHGEFLAFLDSDDVWLPQHLAEQMKLFEQDPTLDLVYCNGLAVGDPNHPHEFMKRCPSNGEANFQALVLERCHIPVSTVVCRRTALQRADWFDETLMRCDDYDMWLRAAFHGAKIGYTRKVQVRLNGGRPGSLGASQAAMNEAAWIILEKALRTLPLSPPDRDLVQSRATEYKALYLLEEGRYRLHLREFDKAKSLFREANAYFHRSKLSLILAGLAIAPRATGKLAALLEGAQIWSLRYLPGRRY
ncbi:MAG: glycosyltransferase family A protein [Candidatus Sulfotelmatobacter sp.]